MNWCVTAGALCGAGLMNLPLAEHITNVIGFMREKADDLGLRGTL